MLLLTFVIFENLRIIYIKNINYDKVEKENKLANENNINKKIFVLTFEKISRNLIHNQTGEIKKEFFTLKKFEKNSNVFLNFNSTSSQTSYSLRSLYSGEYINDFVIQDNKLKNSLFKILNSYGYKIYYLNDIVNYPCRITYVECYKSSNVNESISNKKTIIPIFSPRARVTFVAPVEPLPISSKFLLEIIFVNIYPKGIDPIV